MRGAGRLLRKMNVWCLDPRLLQLRSVSQVGVFPLSSTSSTGHEPHASHDESYDGRQVIKVGSKCWGEAPIYYKRQQESQPAPSSVGAPCAGMMNPLATAMMMGSMQSRKPCCWHGKEKTLPASGTKCSTLHQCESGCNDQ